MNENNVNEFVATKIFELEKKVFELEIKIRELEKRTQSLTHLGITNNENGKELVDRDINRTVRDMERLERMKSNMRKRYEFNDVIYRKARLVLAVVKKYVEDHPDITAEELEKAFPAYEFKIQSFGCVKDINDIPQKIKDGIVRRYFDAVEDLIVLKSGQQMAVCTQWGENIDFFIDYVVKHYGYVITEKKEDL